ncbi:MAG TPA: S8 family serine peptidase, partial [Fimbriimonas sp.]|nr:S8 family serine peptidase [Fimbriimonas sp.]
GVDMLSTYLGGATTYDKLSGTSMSTPFAAGLAGLMIGKNPQITNAKIRDIIFQTCDPIGSWITKGRINAFKAIKQVETLVPFSSTVTSAKVGTVGGVVEGTQIGTYPTLAAAGARLTSAENLTYGVASVKRAQVGSVATVESVSKTTVPLSDILEAKVSFKGRAITGVSCLVFAFNRTTNAWDSIGSKGLTNVDQTATISLPIATLGKYLSAGGEIRFMTRAIAPIRQGSSPSYILQLDQLNFVGSKRATTP